MSHPLHNKRRMVQCMSPNNLVYTMEPLLHNSLSVATKWWKLLCRFYNFISICVSFEIPAVLKTAKKSLSHPFLQLIQHAKKTRTNIPWTSLLFWKLFNWLKILTSIFGISIQFQDWIFQMLFWTTSFVFHHIHNSNRCFNCFITTT